MANTISLYHMPGATFVELYYDHVTKEMVERVRTFISVACLEDYACYVDLKDLAPE